MVDCRSLIEFCRAFEQHRNMTNNNNYSATVGTPSSDHHHHHHRFRTKKQHTTTNSFNPLSYSFCDQSIFAAIDILLLLMVLGSLGVLTVPYFKFIFHEAAELLPLVCVLIGDVIYNAPVAYAVSLVFTFVLLIAIWEILCHKARKCTNPYCKGLRKAVEFDIQLESEECVKCLPPAAPEDSYGLQPLDIGEDHKELEAELKRMAPLNGRTVLIFRAPCGCPAGRMEVWGPKKVRRIKK
ncbi:hypothetical protein AQUCO_01400948v1 [Aquilegia coerulea]|uniref:Ribosomal protein L34e superfamily protein n=1 Tax=Aquilegia coerulea TaxID=218851 RepID=A0A2G5DYY7_AQUCA|nr:hypothetical protein AQUCO_01400948v1 [Aquilegia coerulea]